MYRTLKYHLETMWSQIVNSSPNLKVVETKVQWFTRVFLCYIGPENRRILRLSHVAPTQAPYVFKEATLMLHALGFDLEQSIPHVDESLFTADFIYQAYLIPNVGNKLFQRLPLKVKSNPKLMIEIYQKTHQSDVLRSIPDELRGNPAFMLECVLADPYTFKVAHGRARYSFPVLMAAILKGDDIRAVQIYEESRTREPHFLTMLRFVSENPNVFTMDSAFLTSIMRHREIALKYQFIPEYRSFYDRLQHDIAYYNQLCLLRLGIHNAYNHRTGILRKLALGCNYNKVVDNVCEYIDDFSYGEEVPMSSLLRIAKHLNMKVLI